MSTALLILLLGAVRWTASHVVYGKDPARPIRHSYEEWRPAREAPGYARPAPPHPIPPRYPVFHHSKGYSYAPSKKILQQQLADTSDTVEVFSPAPPSILGSFSVFGHATVNAREPATSHVTKKSPRPQFTADYPLYERPKTSNSYQVRNQFVSPGFYQPVETPKRPTRYNEYNDPYYFDSTLRPPPRDSINKVSSYSPHAQSTSLSPNSFYYEQPQPFQPSAVDNSFDKVRKPINSYHFAATPAYSTPAPIDYRTTINDFDQSSGSYFNTYNKKGSHASSWQRNPFGDIGLGTRRPDLLVKPVVEDKEPAKDIYNQYSHLSRPFQSSQYTTTMDSQRDVDTFSPFVTTFPSPVETHVKFSDVAQPFHVSNEYHTQGGPKRNPDYAAITQDPYNQDVYPVTVTTLEVPTEPHRETKKKYKENYKPYRSDPNSRPFSKSKTKLPQDSFSHHHPHVQITSYQGFNENVPPPFLPTPTPDVHPYAPQPTVEEMTTDQPEVSSNAQEFSYISTIDNKYQDKNEEVTEYPTTTAVAIETTTPSPRTRATIKSRRRPTRPSQSPKTTEGTRFKNHRTPDDEYSTTVDYYKHQRRRKPGNKYRENSEYKRFRTTSTSTTTTTEQPSFVETTEPYEDTTTVSEAPNVNKFAGRPQENQFQSYEHYYNSFNGERAPVEDINSQVPERDIYRAPEEAVNSQVPERDLYSLNYADIFAEPASSSTTTPSTTLSTTTTTTTTTTQSPVSVTTPNIESTASSIPSRLKNKYGSNRPRFSVKDYRDRLNRSTTTSAPTSDDETTPKPKTDIPKILSRMRPSHRPTTEAPASHDDVTPDNKLRKYKPRSGPSRTFYKTSTTAQPDVGETTTTERFNTFRPSTNRYKPGSGKYYSRYRTSSLSPKEVDDSPVTTTARITIKPKGVFSAKRRPFPMKNKIDFNKDEEDSSEDSPSTPNFGDTLKINDNEVIPGILTKKIDDGLTTTISSSEEKELNVVSEAPSSSTNSIPNIPPSGSEAMRVADLTSSSSNDFHMSSIFKTNIVSHRRVLPKITLPTDEPILPLEAFFQTRQKDK
ncbi:hypothetical protein GE061_000780 [Apolygus lucorum]|uniref:Uncharacterized protein n=1 Tax=Apolygus lucorum TaxID=248454 RepID=A0A6A4KL37_APOLU|nr:hypothetical protein GE061_000780 [Apolygus lucorum]